VMMASRCVMMVERRTSARCCWGVVLIGAHEIRAGHGTIRGKHGFCSFASTDELLHGAQSGAPQGSVFVGVGECLLDVRVFARGDLDGGIDGKSSGLHHRVTGVLLQSAKSWFGTWYTLPPLTNSYLAL
jgi:hypothetical protein